MSQIVGYTGNHEPHGSSWPAVETWLEETAAIALARSGAEEKGQATLGRFIPMTMNLFDLEDENITLLGCTLFSNVPKERHALVKAEMNDFRKTKSWSVGEHVKTHRKHVAWLNKEVQKAEEEGRKVVILTHHSPTLDHRAV